MKQKKTDRRELREQYFTEGELSDQIRETAGRLHLEQTLLALSYMEEKHHGQTRKAMKYVDTQIPYIVHPLMMACHALALGLEDDILLAVILLHDVCEDCGVAPEELPFSENVRRIVDLVTKKPHPGVTKRQYTQDYYRNIGEDPKAMLVKAFDRCSNVSTMALSFSDDRIGSYIQETDAYVMPLLQKLEEQEPAYRSAVFVLRYQLVSLLESLKVMLLELQERVS